MTAPSIEIVPYAGWKQALRMANQQVELIASLEVGPRILRFAAKGGVNLFKEIPEQLGKSGEADWLMRGGHRLWAAPEDPSYTYAPDNGPTRHGIEGDTAWITTPADASTGLERTMRLQLDGQENQVSIEHIITNRGSKPMRVAPWALTVFAPGGTAIIPLPPYAPHPGDPTASAEKFAPQLSLALWSYFRFTDRRFQFGDRYVRITQDPKAERPSKIGASLQDGWAAYHRENTLFIKRFACHANAIYPDRGCNFETFTDADILELESLAPIAHLDPGQGATHKEVWSLHLNVGLPKDETEIDATVLPKAMNTR